MNVPPRLGHLLLLLLLLLLGQELSEAKFFIESCMQGDGGSCRALLGYRVVADTKVSSVATMFGMDVVQLMGDNDFNLTLPNPGDLIVQSGELLRIPLSCACSASGIRKANSIFYTVRGGGGDDGGGGDTLTSVAYDVFGGMVTPSQIAEANGLGLGGGGGRIAPSSTNFSQELAAGQRLLIPFPCACNGGQFNGSPAIFISYMVQPDDSLQKIASMFGAEPASIEKLNDLQGDSFMASGDIVEVPLPACASSFDSSASDYGLIVANGSYAITAGRCIQCSCGYYNYPGLDCTVAPSSVASSCSSAKCTNGLGIGGMSTKASSDGCEVSQCLYQGFNSNSSSILQGSLSTKQPSCPGPRSALMYRQYMPALSPDASPIIEPQTVSWTRDGVPPLPAAESSSRPRILLQLQLCSTEAAAIILYTALLHMLFVIAT